LLSTNIPADRLSFRGHTRRVQRLKGAVHDEFGSWADTFNCSMMCAAISGVLEAEMEQMVAYIRSERDVHRRHEPAAAKSK